MSKDSFSIRLAYTGLPPDVGTLPDEVVGVRIRKEDHVYTVDLKKPDFKGSYGKLYRLDNEYILKIISYENWYQDDTEEERSERDKSMKKTLDSVLNMNSPHIIDFTHFYNGAIQIMHYGGRDLESKIPDVDPDIFSAFLYHLLGSLVEKRLLCTDIDLANIVFDGKRFRLIDLDGIVTIGHAVNIVARYPLFKSYCTELSAKTESKKCILQMVYSFIVCECRFWLAHYAIPFDVHDTIFYNAASITEEKEGMNNHHFKKYIMPHFQIPPKLTQLLFTVLEMQYTSDTELLEHLEKLVLIK